jgi:hypothetical protein
MGAAQDRFFQGFVNILGQTRLHNGVIKNHTAKQCGNIHPYLLEVI